MNHKQPLWVCKNNASSWSNSSHIIDYYDLWFFVVSLLKPGGMKSVLGEYVLKRCHLHVCMRARRHHLCVDITPSPSSAVAAGWTWKQGQTSRRYCSVSSAFWARRWAFSLKLRSVWSHTVADLTQNMVQMGNKAHLMCTYYTEFIISQPQSSVSPGAQPCFYQIMGKLPQKGKYWCLYVQEKLYPWQNNRAFEQSSNYSPTKRANKAFGVLLRVKLPYLHLARECYPE